MSSIRRDISTGELIVAGPKGQEVFVQGRDASGKWLERHNENGHWLPAQRASARLSYTGQPLNTETVTIGGNTYTAKTTPSAALDFGIGADQDATYANLAAAIVANDKSIVPSHSAPSNFIALTAALAGTAGNSLALTTTLTSSTAFPFGGGTDGIWTGRVYSARFRATTAFLNSLPLTGFQLIPAVGEKADTNGFGIRLVDEPRCFVIGSAATGLSYVYLEGFMDDSTWHLCRWNQASLIANNDGVPDYFESRQRTYRTTDSGFPIYLKKSGSDIAGSVAFDFVVNYIIDRGTVS